MYDAILLVGFGGPEKSDDVLPFLENVLRGKNVPHERLLAVAEHYEMFGGVSPINEQHRVLLRALIEYLNTHGPQLPVYWGNRNWHPLLAEAIEKMAHDGVRHALAFVTSAFSSYSGCRQYLEDIQLAREEVGPAAPKVDKLRAFYNHPGFIEPMAERVASAVEQVPAERRAAAALIFTAHSIPLAMANGCRYEAQLREACRLVAQRVGRPEWTLVYQSRSGSPAQPWLEPDVCDHLAQLGQQATVRDVVIVPIGFLSDHVEVIYDLDIEARAVCEHFGIEMVRSLLVGSHPRFVRMIRELIRERVDANAPRLAVGNDGPSHDVCPPDCCPQRVASGA
jgi:ferrochelatase